MTTELTNQIKAINEAETDTAFVYSDGDVRAFSSSVQALLTQVRKFVAEDEYDEPRANDGLCIFMLL